MISILQFVLDNIGLIASSMLLLLPNSPFSWIYDADRSFLGYMNFVFPISAVISELATYVACVLIYYSIRTILRWVKLSSD
jgi:hypothetical protein